MSSVHSKKSNGQYKSILPHPYDFYTTEELYEKIEEYTSSKKCWIKMTLKAVPDVYTNKSKKTHNCWKTVNGKYLRKRKDDEEPPLYEGYTKFNKDIHCIYITEENFINARNKNNLSEFIISRQSLHDDDE